MPMKGFTRRFKPLKILTEEQVDWIHKATLDVLRETGIRFESEKALNFFKENGCEVDFDKKRVKFPESLVEECLRKCPSNYRVKARDPKNDLLVGGDLLYFNSQPGMRAVDIDTWEPRTPTRKENYDGVKVLDALDNLHAIHTYTPYFGFEGVPPVMCIPESVAAKIRNSSKIQTPGYSMDCEIFTIKMAKAIGMDILTFIAPSPPLTYYGDAVEAAFRYAEAGLTISMGCGAVYGGTAPATIAGSVVLDNAECAAGIVLVQLIKPGTRVYIYNFAYPMDMRSGSPAFGAIGASLHAAAITQIFRRYRIPVHINVCGYTSSKRIDFQCGYEKVIPTLVSALSGANILAVVGGLHGELTHHPVQAVLDDDVAGMIGRFLEGVEVNDETLALDLIEEVGPIPGYYLNKEHTRKWWKKEQFVPKAADRLTYPEWMKMGKKSCIDYAKERVEEILATHEPKPLTDNQEDAIESILKEAREYYRKKNLISDEEWAKYKKTLESPNYPYA